MTRRAYDVTGLGGATPKAERHTGNILSSVTSHLPLDAAPAAAVNSRNATIWEPVVLAGNLG